MKKAALFDLDGTTVDTVGDINLALNRALGTNFTNEECNRFVGNGLKVLVSKALKVSGLDQSKLEDYYSDLLKYYHECPVKYSHPYPGVTKTIKELVKKGVKVGIFSNKNQDLLETVVSSCFPEIKFDFVAGRNGKYKAKPDPEAIYAFCNLCGITKEELLYVGDSEVDYQCASDASVESRIILGGTRTVSELEECNVPKTVMLDKIDDILQLFD